MVQLSQARMFRKMIIHITSISSHCHSLLSVGTTWKNGNRVAECTKVFHFTNRSLACFWGKSNLKMINVCPIKTPPAQALLIVCKKAIHFSANENWNGENIVAYFLTYEAGSGAVRLMWAENSCLESLRPSPSSHGWSQDTQPAS